LKINFQVKSYVDKYLSNGSGNGSEILFRPNYEINQVWLNFLKFLFNVCCSPKFSNLSVSFEVFTHQHEQIFEEHLISSDCQRKITRDFLRKEAYNFAIKCNVHVPKTWNVRKQAGLDWMYGYLNRHPKIKSIIVRNKKDIKPPFQIMNHVATEENCIISIEDIPIENDDSSSYDEMRTVKALRENRIVNMDEYVETDDDSENLFSDYSYLSKINVKSPLDEFLDNIMSAYGTIAKNGIVDAEEIYNLGEIALVVDELLSKNRKQLLVTACCFVNAAGDSLPPFFVFPQNEFCLSLLEGLPEGATGTTRPSGRLDNSAFILVLEHFQRLVKVTPGNKVVLIMDVDEHHITIDSLDFCQNHGIELVSLPPHYGPNLQPTENYIFPTIRFLFNQCLDQFRVRKHSYLTPKRIAMLFCRIQKIAFSSSNVSKGFSENGIFPLNDRLFNTDEFLSRKSNHYEPTVNLTDITLDFPEEEALLNEINADEDAFVEEKLSVYDQDMLLTERFSSDETPVNEFFNNLVQAYSELEAHGGIRPEKIYNVDEIEILVSNLESNYSKHCISMCCYANAVGHTLPPFLVYPENEFSPAMLVDGIEGMRGTTSGDGRIDNTIFFQMLQHFQQCVSASPSNRIIVIMDCESYHISLKTIEFCESTGIILVTVPEHILQDFQPIKKIAFQTLFFEKLLSNFEHHVEAGPESSISMFDVAGLLSKTFESCFTVENIVSEFKMSGLWPLDHDLIAPNSAWPAYTVECDLNDVNEGNIVDAEEDDKDVDSHLGSNCA